MASPYRIAEPPDDSAEQAEIREFVREVGPPEWLFDHARRRTRPLPLLVMLAVPTLLEILLFLAR